MTDAKQKEIAEINADLATFTSLLPRKRDQRPTRQCLPLPRASSPIWSYLGSEVSEVYAAADAGNTQAIEWLKINL